jgi:NAD(P)-dependent dehydrogenase (short-subunit alcohol dehydrogenase family)
LEQTQSQLRKEYPGIEVQTIQASITDDLAVEQACAITEADFGRIDILLNNAGISMNKPSLELTPAEWRRAIDIDLSGVFYCSQAAGKRMVRQSGGVIVSTSSIWGLSASANRLAYCASKAGVISLTKCLAAEWAKHGIRVNAICPGYTHTALMDDLMERGVIDHADLCSKTPMNRLGHPDEMAEAALYMASDAAAFVTGHALVSDGGWLADGY